MLELTVRKTSVKILKKYHIRVKSFSARPKGGAKGAHAPPKRPQGIPCPPRKKKVIIELMTPKASFYSNTYAITECKNGRALVKHGNFLP